MQNRGVVVVNVAGIFDWRQAIFVGLAESDPAFGSTAGKDAGKSVGVVLAAFKIERKRRSTKFGADGDQRIVEQTSLFEVFDYFILLLNSTH